VEGANDGLWDWNLLTDEIYFSPRAKRLLGLEDADDIITAEAWNARVHPDDLERLLEREKAHLDGDAEFYSCEYRVLDAEGRYGWVLDRGTCLCDADGRPYRMAGSLGDITQRKRGEQFLRSVVDTIPGALNIRDQDGRFVLINQTLADYYGIDSKQAIGKLSEEIIPKTAMAEKEEVEIRQVIETGAPIVDSEYQYRRDGETEYWLTTRQPINDPVGQLQYVLTVAYEITELRRAQDALRESQQFLATLVDNIPAVIFFRDLDGRFIRVNRRYAEMFEVTQESIIGKSVYDLFPKERADEFTALDRAAIERGQVLNHEERFIVQGEERIFDELNFPILDSSGEVIAVGGVDIDITDLTEVQEALRESQERLVQALESISEAFALCDADDRLVLFNSRYRRMFFPFHEDLVQEGETFESITRRNVESGMVELGDQDTETFLAERLERHRNPRGAFLQQQADGRWVQIDERKTEDGGTVGVGTDITELKKAEIDLTLARDEAMRATRAKSRFLANMSHELRTPMNAIIGFTRLVMRRSKDRLEPKQYGNLEKILISSEHLLSLINDILDISKIEAGHAVVQPVRFDLIEVVEDCLKTVEPLAESRRLALVRQHGEDLPELDTDKEKLRQILINLLSNAVKFTEEGSVTVATRGQAGDIVIEVTDTGIGIPADAIEHIFEEFSQVDDSSTRQFGGTGLGLAITCHLVSLLGGQVSVKSEVGAGSTFTVSIPAHYVAPESAADTRVAS
jgi:PAS domain S-box-containing protein